jgi:hypothetical protein
MLDDDFLVMKFEMRLSVVADNDDDDVYLIKLQ